MSPPAPEALDTVLVVDDDPGMRDTLVEILMANGILAEGAGSAAAAMARSTTLRAAAAVVDQRLPDSSGIELCGRLKANDPDLQAILLTGYATLETAIAAVGHLDEFLTKPVPPDQLVRVVGAALAKRRLRRENAVLVQQLRQANSDLEESVAERNRDLSGLTAMAEDLGKAVLLGEVVPAVTAAARAATDAAGAAVYLTGSQRPALALAAREGDGRFPDAFESWNEAEGYLAPPGRHTVFSPLVVAGHRLGLLVLTGPRLARSQLLGTMATQAALAIQNAQRLGRERETVERLEELARMKSAFLATVSHELRTPLAALVGFSEVLASRWADLPGPDRQHILGRMVAQGERLRRLIENLLDSTSLEMGTLRIHAEPLDLGGLLREVIESHPSGSDIDLELAPDLPPISADGSRLAQVIANLLDNAVKHAGSDGFHVRVIAFLESEDQVEVAVADQGPGIEPSFLPRLFDAFTQADDADHHARGVGLGLHITRGIVEAMGGTIGVDSRLGHGTTFWFRLPVAAA